MAWLKLKKLPKENIFVSLLVALLVLGWGPVTFQFIYKGFLKLAAPNNKAKYQSTSGQTLRSPPWWGREAAWPRRRPPWCSSAWTGPCPAASTHSPPPFPPHQPYPQKPSSAPLVPGLLWIGGRWWGKRQKTIFPQSLDLTAPDTWIQIFI